MGGKSRSLRSKIRPQRSVSGMWTSGKGEEVGMVWVVAVCLPVCLPVVDGLGRHVLNWKSLEIQAME